MTDAAHVIDVGFAGNRVRIVTDSARAADAVHFLFGPHRVSDGVPAGRQIVLAEDPERGGFVMACDGRFASSAREDELELALVQLVQYHLVADASDVGLFHAGALVRDARVLLLAADSGSGKTTLTASLLAEGYDFLSDEVSAVDAAGCVDGFSRPLNVKPGSLPLLRSLPALRTGFANSRLSGGVTLVPWPRSAQSGMPLALVLLPEYRAGAALEIEQPSPGRAAAALMGCLLNARNLPRNGLTLAARLAASVPVVRATYSRVEDVHEWLKHADGIVHVPVGPALNEACR
ncbi:hypothetical protein [Pseudazoarcus pumilus]|uniref:HprK-related kinase A n=1 Tax=Pseudazoarcus pumilus TaxID=2067960 RepID=A0A2I6S393_9RHOO|nr:hypothetical protein [Pseudazoarcus pumilus]AUN93723.1 hypothetical protein C0099_01495 [Pseudazoarcus pumilus]